MPITNLQLRHANITLVYKELNFDVVSIDGLRRLLPQGTRPVITEFPADVIVVQYPNGILLQFLNRRLRLDDPSSRSITESPLPAMMAKAHEACSQTDLVAYGYNYDVTFTLPDVSDAGAHLAKRFLKEPNEIATRLGGKIIRLNLELVYPINDVQYSLRFEQPGTSDTIVAHLNAHYVENSIPKEESMRQQFIQHYHTLCGVLEDLFSWRDENVSNS